MSGFDDSGRKRVVVYIRDALNSFRTSVRNRTPIRKTSPQRYLVSILLYYSD